MKKIFTKKRKTAFLYVVLPLLLSMAVLHKAAIADNALVLAVHPYLSHEELTKKFTPIANYLSREIGQPITVKIGSDYEQHIQYIGLNKVDIAYMGPASYVKVVHEFGNKPLLTRLEINGEPWFQGNIIARKDSGISNLDELKGKRIAFGSPDSTMSYIVPNHMLTRAGVFADPLTKHQFLYSHNNVALAVLSGDFDAGAVKPAVFKKFKAHGLVTIANTPKISEHLFITRTKLPAELREKLRQAMLRMDSSAEGSAALQVIKKSITALVEVRDEDYDNLREIIFSPAEAR